MDHDAGRVFVPGVDKIVRGHREGANERRSGGINLVLVFQKRHRRVGFPVENQIVAEQIPVIQLEVEDELSARAEQRNCALDDVWEEAHDFIAVSVVIIGGDAVHDDDVVAPAQTLGVVQHPADVHVVIGDVVGTDVVADVGVAHQFAQSSGIVVAGGHEQSGPLEADVAEFGQMPGTEEEDVFRGRQSLGGFHRAFTEIDEHRFADDPPEEGVITLDFRPVAGEIVNPTEGALESDGARDGALPGDEILRTGAIILLERGEARVAQHRDAEIVPNRAETLAGAESGVAVARGKTGVAELNGVEFFQFFRCEFDAGGDQAVAIGGFIHRGIFEQVFHFLLKGIVNSRHFGNLLLSYLAFR